MRPPSRRDLLSRVLGPAIGLGALGALGAARRPALARADGDGVAGHQRRFLFVYANGGWDPLHLFAPLYDVTGAYCDPTGTAAEVGGLTFIDSGNRPSVRAFFEAHAHRACTLNGFEVRSIAHDNCRRLLMTGTTSVTADDWGAILAAEADDAPPAPYLVVTGPSFAAARAQGVVRAGSAGQLGALLDGSTLDGLIAERRTPWGSEAAAAVDAVVAARVARRLAASPDAWAASYATSVDDLARLHAAAATTSFVAGPTFAEQASVALDALATGASRCALVTHNGVQDLTWDSHGVIRKQSDHFEDLFAALGALLTEMESRVGVLGVPLIEEICVVVVSEMGRTPYLNELGGKDHWTYTSAMLVGSGVAGGRSIGGYDDRVTGLPVDLLTGESTQTGTPLLAAHLGATLLALADIDPAEHVQGVEPVRAMIAE